MKEKLTDSGNDQTPTPLPGEEKPTKKDGSWRRFVQWVWTNSEKDAPFWEQWLRPFFRIFVIVFQEVDHDRVSLRASALTFTVVLSLVPMLALGTAVLKGLGAGGQMRRAAYAFIDTLEFNDMPEQSTAPSLPPAPPLAPEASLSPSTNGNSPDTQDSLVAETLTIHLRRAVDTIFDYVERTNFATIGAFGIAGLLIAVVVLLSSIEQAMNEIWQAKSNRPISRQIMSYLGLMVLLPIAINVALATMAMLQSPVLLAKLQKAMPVSWLGPYLLKVMPVLAVSAIFSVLYKLLPNTLVKTKAAVIGGVIGGLGWLLVQSVYIKMQLGVARYNAIYGSFATLPLLLLWLYVAWLIFLTGAEISFAVQVWERYERKKVLLNPLTRLAIAFDVIDLSFADFRSRTASNLTNLAQRLRQPDTYVASVLHALVDGGILRQVSEEEELYMPAAPVENIDPAEVVELIFGKDGPKARGTNLASLAVEGAKRAIAGKKLSRTATAGSAPS